MKKGKSKVRTTATAAEKAFALKTAKALLDMNYYTNWQLRSSLMKYHGCTWMAAAYASTKLKSRLSAG